MVTLVTGGARSGKSSFAQQYVRHYGSEGIYLATAEALDVEMQDRIVKHKEDRKHMNFQWTTIESSLEAAQQLDLLKGKYDGRQPIVLLDCLTLWLSNWMLYLDQKENKAELLSIEMNRLISSLVNCPYHVVVVTNEVGNGIVPESRLGRHFRDEAGRLNQMVAAVAKQVFLVTAGIPIELKALQFQFKEKQN